MNTTAKVALVLLLCSFLLPAGQVDLTSSLWPYLGDAKTGGTYINSEGIEFSPSLGMTQTIIGGENDTANSHAVAVGTIESTLGLSPGDLDALLGDSANEVITNGSAMYRSVTVAAGDYIDVSLNFVANDAYDSYTACCDDFGFFSINGFSPILLGRINMDLFGVEPNPYGAPYLETGDYMDTTYYHFIYTFANAGTYTLGLGVVNVEPIAGGFAATADSALLIDSGEAPAPEPASWLLTASAGLAAALWRRKKAARS